MKSERALERALLEGAIPAPATALTIHAGLRHVVNDK